MEQATFYFQDNDAPKPNKPNHIGSTILIEYNNMLLLEHRVDSEKWAIIGGGLHVDGLIEKPLLVCSHESRELRFFTKGELNKVNLVETHIPILLDYLKEG
ncbi:MAG TPA: hypothetical protein VJY54_03785 [Lachnospiraceae bacterium]|nr:hypothetical protein [Lachnospiraceae bacterium]